MRIYSASSEETLRARKLLKEWADDGWLTAGQYKHLEEGTHSELRTTNIYLRLVLFLFTLISVGGAIALFFIISRPSEQTTGVFLMIFGIACYAAAEVAVSQARLYRFGIEEALAAFAVGFLCAGMLLAFFNGDSYWLRPNPAQALVPAAGAILSLWIWHRFGYSYAFLAAMIFVVFLPAHWTSSRSAQHVIIAAFYACGLVGVAIARARHRFDYLEKGYSFVEAFLWFGLYLTINLKVPSSDPRMLWLGSARTMPEFGRPFYWATWVLIWWLPPVVLARGIRMKDRFIIMIGGILAILTFVSNKPYLGWPRHTWDPMILGILLTAAALFIRSWLAAGTNGIRKGFTAARLSGKDKKWMNATSAALGLMTPQAITPGPQHNAEFRFGGGSSGGGGASGEF